MTFFVLDASSTFLLLGLESADAEVRLSEALQGGALVPGLWHLEIANALLCRARREKWTDEITASIFFKLAELPVTVDDMTASHAWGDTLKLAVTYCLTTYDAAYLELALRKNIKLATLDNALIRAAKQVEARLLFVQ